jgi:NhaC family Na+:H+ antiporter
MFEFTVFALFALSLVTCVATGHSIVYALITGFLLFFFYGLCKGFSAKNLLGMAASSAKKVLVIALVMLLIGALTASWRAAGTIAYLVSCGTQYLGAEYALLAAFLLNGALSTLIGTSFGTVATMGVITMTLLTATGYPVWLAGGAILAGIYVGDRCSPVSTSALLVSTVTATNIYRNLVLMLRTGLVPFVLSCAVYLGAGFLLDTAQAAVSIETLFARAFALNFWTLIPALVLVAAIALRLDIRITMAASLLSAVPVCLLDQGMTLSETARALLFGFTAKDAEVAAMLDGGGVFSMLTVVAIVLISSTYAGLFNGTGLNKGLKRAILRLSEKLSPFATIVITSVTTVAIACNQALPIMLTRELCSEVEPDRQKLAIALENSVVVIAPLIPWCIAGAIPLAILSAPASSVLAACYLWLLPLWGLIAEKSRSRQTWWKE